MLLCTTKRKTCIEFSFAIPANMVQLYSVIVYSVSRIHYAGRMLKILLINSIIEINHLISLLFPFCFVNSPIEPNDFIFSFLFDCIFGMARRVETIVLTYRIFRFSYFLVELKYFQQKLYENTVKRETFFMLREILDF